MIAGPEGVRVMLLDGEPLEGPRCVWWNFVASSKERIEEATEAWRRGDWEINPMLRLPPGDDREFIPLPGKQGSPLDQKEDAVSMRA